jgi:carbamoyltransferase
MIVLGLNAFHGDSSAALLKDGKLIAAVEEERFRRLKHWAGFPSQSIAYCLEEAGVSLEDVDHIAINQDSRAHLFKKLAFVATHRPNLGAIAERLLNRKARAGIPEHLATAFPGKAFRGQVHAVEHHVAHLSSAFHVSPFEQAVAVSVDGFGDFSSGAWGVGRGADISVDGQIFFPHSLGIFYQAITQYLGFPHYGDEYKVMGLAPYGRPTYMEQMRKLVLLKSDGTFELDLRYFRHHTDNISFEWKDGSPSSSDLFHLRLQELLGPRRDPSAPLEDKHRDMARSAQAMYEEAFFNSVANGKVRRQTPFKRVYIQSAAGDAGGAIGAAFATWHKLGGKRSFVMDHAYWGPQFGKQAIDQLVSDHRAEIEASDCTVEDLPDEAELCRRTAAAVADGKVVGWFQGRMEWGPRALGNRSIVCDPRRGDMKAILNAKIKRRESFRPFAPSVMEEAVSGWFEEDDAVPFMMQVFQIREEKRPLIPAVTHVDGSGRLQTVSAATNPRYHKLIAAFEAVSGVPMILNTSFNENEPVVCKPKEALDCFLRTKMDVLVLGNTLIMRREAGAP